MGKKEVTVQDEPSFLTPKRSEFGALQKQQSWEEDTLFGHNEPKVPLRGPRGGVK